VIGDFHFLRPWWLAALLPVVILAWQIHRATSATSPWRGIVDDHLLPYLVRDTTGKQRRGPWRLIVAGWILATIILAGPAWRREPPSFAADVAVLAVVIKVTPSMQTEDIAPDRLTRSVQKVHDLLARRGGAKSALIAYAGSAHLVMPPTVDAEIIDTFAASLDPKIMPGEGDAAAEALKLADRTLASSGGGSILWIADEVSADQLAAIAGWRKTSRTQVRLLAPLAEPGSLSQAADVADAKVIRLVPEDSDVAQLERAAKFSSSSPLDGGDRWQDGGYWLTPLLLLGLLPFFRKGWMPSLAARS